MTISSYPADLPPPIRADYAEQSGEGRALFRPDAGPSQPRLRFAAVVDDIPFTISVKRWQLALFDRFYDETLKKGTLPFTMPAPLVDGFAILDEDGVPLLDENDAPLLYGETMLVTFADQGLPRRTSLQADLYRVSFRLGRLPV